LIKNNNSINTCRFNTDNSPLQKRTQSNWWWFIYR